VCFYSAHGLRSGRGAASSFPADIPVTKTSLQIISLSFQYEQHDRPLFNRLSTSFEPGWTGLVGPNGSGKTTLARLIAGELYPASGQIIGIGPILHTVQVPESPPAELFDLFARTDSDALKIISLLKLEYDWPYRWDTLSYGERKRCQIGGAAAAGTEVLILDEPTNHLDSETREAVAAAMETFEGVGILISHDIALLDRFCRRILFLPGGMGIPGNFTQAAAQRDRLTREAIRDHEAARADLSRLRKEAARRRCLAEDQQKRRSKKNLDRKDSDGRARLDLVRISGKDGTGGRLLRQLDGALKQAETRFAETTSQAKPPSGITVMGRKSGADAVWRTVPRTLFYNGKEGPGLVLPELAISPGDRIVVSGANGTGKSTLLRQILEESGGDAWLLEQEFGKGARKDLMGRFNSLGREASGRVVSSVCRMGSNPELFLSSEDWSPGEGKKAALALALEDRLPDCPLLLLDEPMNHLDIEARTLLAEALDGFTGAIVAVTHEALLRDRWKAVNWSLEETAAGAELKIL